MSAEPMVIDVQAHIFPPAYLDALRRIASGAGRAADTARGALANPLTRTDRIFTADIDRRLELMNSAGVALQVLEFAAPNIWSDDVETRLLATRAFNDGVAGIVHEYPDRFAFAATLPVPYIDAALVECRRALDDLGAVGVTFCTQFDGMKLDDPRLDPLYAYLSERECPVLLHPEGFSVRGALADHGMEWALGTPFDDTIATVRLIYGGVLDRFPGIRWVVPHLGGVLPFIAKRLDFIWQLTPDVRALLATPPSEYLRRLWYDTANPDPRALHLSIEVLGADRLLYASDFPFAQRGDLRPGLAGIEAVSLDTAARAAVRGGTAQTVFGIAPAV